MPSKKLPNNQATHAEPSIARVVDAGVLLRQLLLAAQEYQRALARSHEAKALDASHTGHALTRRHSEPKATIAPKMHGPVTRAQSQQGITRLSRTQTEPSVNPVLQASWALNQANMALEHMCKRVQDNPLLQSMLSALDAPSHALSATGLGEPHTHDSTRRKMPRWGKFKRSKNNKKQVSQPNAIIENAIPTAVTPRGIPLAARDDRLVKIEQLHHAFFTRFPYVAKNPQASDKPNPKPAIEQPPTRFGKPHAAQYGALPPRPTTGNESPYGRYTGASTQGIAANDASLAAHAIENAYGKLPPLATDTAPTTYNGNPERTDSASPYDQIPEPLYAPGPLPDDMAVENPEHLEDPEAAARRLSVSEPAPPATRKIDATQAKQRPPGAAANDALARASANKPVATPADDNVQQLPKEQSARLNKP